MATVETHTFLKFFWTMYTILGAIDPRRSWPYFIYSVCLQVLVTICYPLHVVLNLMQNESSLANIENLALCITALACVLKFCINAWNQRQIHELKSIMEMLDERATSAKEQMYYFQLRREVLRIHYAFFGLYTMLGVAAELMFLFRSERSLLYPAYFPFDWRSSNWKFYIAHLYQICGVLVLLMENMGNDFMPPVLLATLAGHVKLLGIRASQIGYKQPHNYAENEAELVRCIKDQKKIYRLYECIQEIISVPMFIQIMVAAFNICLAFAAVVFYISELFDRVYYIAYIFAMALQIFPTCYYGTYFAMVLEKLPSQIYASNWIGQSRIFRKHLILFCERSLRIHPVLAGGLIRLHLDTFLSTIKGAYSLLAVVMKVDQ